MIRKASLLMCIALCLSVLLTRYVDCTAAQKPQVGHKSARKTMLLWGFINKRGQVVVPPRFDSLDQFQEGLAGVAVGNKWGYIDRTGRVVIPVQFKTAFDFSEGLAAACLPGQKMGYIGKDGKWVIKPRFDSAVSFSEGLAFVMSKTETAVWTSGYIDKTGQMVIEDLGGGNFSGGIALVAGKGDQLFFIDKMGSRVSPDLGSSSSGLHFSDGLAAFNKDNNWKWGYIDTKGRVIVKQQFDSARDFHEGLASVSVDDKRIGFIDKQGNWVLKPRSTWQWTSDFIEGLARVQSSSGRSGFIDKKGRWVIAPKFDSLGDFHEGLAAAYSNKKWGYINKQGRWVIHRPDYPVNMEIDPGDETWSFHEGMAPCVGAR